MSEQAVLTAAPEDKGSRIDKYISDNIAELTRSAVQGLIEKGLVLAGGKAISKNYKLRGGEEVIVTIPEPEPMDAVPEDIPLDIVYEDDDLLVVNKPKGMVVHPAHGNYTGTLVNALLHHCGDSLSGINGVIRPGIVHRIDKNTSGLLIVAKNDASHLKLAEQIKVHSFTREYEAVACGYFKDTEGTVDAPIGRHKTDRKKMCVTTENSRNAVTHYSVIKQYGGYAHVRLRLETGRTHQIRVHLSYIGHPVLGDDVYGKPYKGLEGQCLHARKIGFIHPTTGEYMEFESDLPDYFVSVLNKLEKM
ncbi:RluA family pseudouridine synthase [Ruminococcus flavefaciens]|uniref:Pseudouridine synthase n=1 Tax=Ruminococcus flavefaciens TaxID=1265 RepID=A0A315Y0J4_RUMFL|nr:RluA family pseudouridine synthase [Ruminococcus flavefaciens]PWJ12667.1 23S rRNA pseudouridine1911/1915/1917 synthase [Ruminococcus flavefaciens]SSA49244.1 23S rRNA pseudouridine1911/1915/1917 synthase [Ruminococcus flavefaciens]